MDNALWKIPYGFWDLPSKLTWGNSLWKLWLNSMVYGRYIELVNRLINKPIYKLTFGTFDIYIYIMEIMEL